jgi:putative transcriptional regulator
MATEDAPLTGRLLIAAPTLRDPNFDRTIVLIIDHDDDGALGVVLNRPSELAVRELLPTWHERAATPPVIFSGGPVADGVAIGLGVLHDGARLAVPTSDDAATAGWSQLVAGLGVIDLARDPDAAGGLAQVRIFSGYAGWSSGQLEGELAQGAWYVCDARPDDVMSEWPARLWREVLRRQPAPLSMLALYPADPSLN